MDTPWLERRVGALISAYAERAPVDVDAIAVTRYVTATSSGDRRRPAVAPFNRGLAIGLVIVGMLVALVAGALAVGGNPLRRDPQERLTEQGVVPPFLGLPPVGAAPSTPERGELVLRAGGRMHSIGDDMHAMLLDADGRLIWGRNLEGSHPSAWRSAFGPIEPTTALIEQRLTRDGVTLLLSRVAASVWPGEFPASGSWTVGIHCCGVSMRKGDQMADVAWSDPDLPGLLADPGSWLPASAWADRELRGYVPTRYAACIGPEALKLSPAAATEILLATGTRNADGCYVIEMASARAIATILDRSGFRSVPNHSGLEYEVSDNPSGFTLRGITPDGGVAGWGG